MQRIEAIVVELPATVEPLEGILGDADGVVAGRFECGTLEVTVSAEIPAAIAAGDWSAVETFTFGDGGSATVWASEVDDRGHR